MTPCLTGCLEEFTPTDFATADQVQSADKRSLSNAVAAYMTSATMSADGGTQYDIGFMGFAIWRDAMTADLPIYKQGYDYFSVFGYNTQLGDYSLQSLFWQRYYYLVQKANLVLGVTDPEVEEELP